MGEINADDTALDAIAAQVRSFHELGEAQINDLLAAARGDGRGDPEERLVEHHLSVALAAALEHADRGVDVPDLYQEGTLAVIVAVGEYVARDGDGSGLRRYIEKVVAKHLESAIAEAKAQRDADLAVVRAAEKLDVAEANLRNDLARQPTDEELAQALEWPIAQVLSVRSALTAAREMWDDEIVQYLDDDETDGDE